MATNSQHSTSRYSTSERSTASSSQVDSTKHDSSHDTPENNKLENNKLEIRGLTTIRDEFTLGPIDLVIRSGTILGLIGSNGAGKTTLLHSLLGLLPSTEGTVHLGAQELRGRTPSVLARVGFVPDDETAVIEELTATELWKVHARAHARQTKTSVDEILTHASRLAEAIGFEPPERKIIGDFSHGMRKKTQLVAALLHRPELVVLDEPRNGLDPLGIAQTEQLLRGLRSSGAIVIVSSHDLAWAERVCDEVCIVHQGSVVASGLVRDVVGDFASLTDAFFSLLGVDVAQKIVDLRAM